MELIPDYEMIAEMQHEKLNQLRKNRLDLAEKIDIGESQISRYFNKKTNIKYHTVKQINNVLRNWEEQQRKPARELMMDGEIEWATPEDTCGDAAEKMKANLYSQLPVCDEDGVVGIVTDIDLIEHESDDLIGDIDLQHLIQVEQDAPRELLKKILEHDHPAILVVDDGSPVGLVTRFDLLNTS